MKRLALSIAYILLLSISALAQVEDYKLDPRIRRPHTVEIIIDPALMLANETRPDFRLLYILSPEQKQQLARTLGLILKAQIILREEGSSENARGATLRARDAAIRAANIFPKDSSIQKLLIGDAYSLYSAWAVDAKIDGKAVLSREDLDSTIEAFGLAKSLPYIYMRISS